MASTQKTFTTPPLRCGYVNVFEAKLNQFNNNEEYSLQLIIHKQRDKEFLAELTEAVDAILTTTFKGKVPKGAHNPIVDAAEWHEEKGRPLPDWYLNEPFVSWTETLTTCWIRVSSKAVTTPGSTSTCSGTPRAPAVSAPACRTCK